MHPFAMGAVYARPAGAVVTPVPIAVLTDGTVEFKQTKAFLSGQYKVPIDAGEGALDISIKFKNQDFRASVLAMVLAGTSTAASSTTLAITGESATVPAVSGPYTVTVAQSATFVEDGGVLDLTAGKWLTCVVSGPTTGQYIVSAGVYTFAAADTLHALSIVYSYTSTTAGVTLTYQNQVMGPSTGYGLRAYNLGRLPSGVIVPCGYKFWNVHFDNLQHGFKADGFASQDLSGRAIQDTASMNVFQWFVGE